MVSSSGAAAERRTWPGLAFGVVAVALLVDVLVRHGPIGVDFHTYVAAAQVAVQRGWSHLYDFSAVAAAQKQLAPNQVAQPFLSPPTVAVIVIPFAFIPYQVAYAIWAAVLFVCLAAALAWAGVSSGLSKWIAVLGALSPWFVMHAINLGQVVPLVAAATLVAWRLLRDRRDVLAGVVLAAILLKPNTAILVPAALLFAARFRAFAAWGVAAGIVVVATTLLIGPSATTDYIDQLRGPLPRGADALTLHGALSATGAVAATIRILIIAAVVAAAVRLRHSSGLVVPIAIVGSLVVSPYLHASDLVMLAVAGWMVWEERPAVSWRVVVAAVWVLASPFLFQLGHSLHLRQWPWVELAVLAALLIAAWAPFTTWADSRKRAPA